MMTQDITVLTASAKNLAEAWENACEMVYYHGIDIQTQYDKPDDPPSKDCTMVIVVSEPLSEPMIHRDMPCGLEDLQEYVMEVCDGIKNHWVRDPDDPDDTRWEYTYNERLFHYVSAPSKLKVNCPKCTTLTSGLSNCYLCKGDGYILATPYSPQEHDQIEIAAQKLAKASYTRRAQAVTWKTWEDNKNYDPPCIQRLWWRCVDNGSHLSLAMNVHIRSNDAYKAAFMNMFAFIMLQMRVAKRVEELTGRPVIVGRYCHIADSFHIYGSYLNEFKSRFIGAIHSRSFEERTFSYSDVKPIMDDAIPGILEKVKNMDV